MKPHIVVLGSSNTDMVVRLPRLPGPGETILGGVFSMVPSVRAAGILAASAGTRFILNPAPALPIDDELLRIVSVLTPNEHEAEVLTGVDTTDDRGVVRAAHALQARGTRTVIITLGGRGAYVRENDESAWIPPFAVKTVDCTGAGDVFNGALAVALGEGLTPFEAARFAGAAAAIAVTRHGAQPSVPTRSEIDSLLLS